MPTRSKKILKIIFYPVYLSSLMFLLTLASFTSTPASARSAADDPAFVRVIHASPFVGTTDVFLDGTKALSNFQFGTVTDYLTIPPGPHKVQIALIGKGIGAAVINQTLAVQPGIAYTVAALGASATTLSLKVFADDNRIASGMAKVRFYHLSPGMGDVNVLRPNDSALVNGLSYPDASPYLTVQPGSYTFNVLITDPATTRDTTVELTSNKVISVFVVGVFNGTPKMEFVSAQVSATPSLPKTGSDPSPLALLDRAIPQDMWFVGLLLALIPGILFLALRTWKRSNRALSQKA